ncbi:MAG TPA: hypothetical protein VKQ36_15750 [Ktedonobacterales bacterium]|nr:hypothetical protein [Ktedonobacterales bacterium]
MTSNSGGLGARHLLVRDWATRRGQRMQRLGRYLTSARARMGDTPIREVVRLARQMGERLNTKKVSEIEQLRDDGPDDANELRNDVSLMAVWFMVRFYGYSLADLERYMLSGEEPPGEPGEQQRADLVQRAFLALPEPERRELENYVEFLYQKASARTLDVDNVMPPDDAPPRQRRALGQRPNSENELATRSDSENTRRQPRATEPPVGMPR